VFEVKTKIVLKVSQTLNHLKYKCNKKKSLSTMFFIVSHGHLIKGGRKRYREILATYT
jgi:hypothetical protein